MNIRTALTWIGNALWVQVALAFIYIPILIAWGLPISAASIVGNLVFPVFLITFLALSAVLFVASVCGVTFTAAAWALDTVTAWWLWALSFAHPRWLIGFINPGLSVLIAIAIGGVCCIWFTRHLRPWAKLAIASTVLAIILLGLKLFQTGPETLTLHYRGKDHLIVRDGSDIMLIMRPIHGPINSIDSWISFTLANTLEKQYGTNTLSQLILINPSPSVLAAFEGQRPLRIGSVVYVDDQIHQQLVATPARRLVIDARRNQVPTIEISKAEQ